MLFLDLPIEIIDFIFNYLHKHDIIYSFLELNSHFLLIVKRFVGQRLDLIKINNEIIFQYCISKALRLIGSNLHYLSIGYPYCLSSYIKFIQIYGVNLDKLTIYCCSDKEDIRRYVAQLVHHKLESLTFIFNDKVVGEQISLRIRNTSINEELKIIPIASSLRLYLSSINDLSLLKRYSESYYISNGLYMIQSISTNEWLTYTTEGLYVIANEPHYQSIFSIKQTDNDQYCLEYKLYHEQTQRPLTVLICHDDEERWISSSILSVGRKESSQSCSNFTFERINGEREFYIRPCYSNAKRLQLLGKSIIVSFSNNDTTLDHRFRFYPV